MKEPKATENTRDFGLPAEPSEAGRVAKQPTPSAPPWRSGPPSEVDEAKFLADEFDVPERKAAAAVAPDASDDQVTTIAAELHQRRAADDPLADVPVPRSPAQDLVRDADEVALKPVLHTKNERSGAG